MRIRQPASTIQLYTVNSYQENMSYYPDYSLTLRWYVEDRHKLPVPLEQVIWHYDPKSRLNGVAGLALAGCFTSKEAKLLKQHLDKNYNYETEIREVRLPMSMRRAALLLYARRRQDKRIWQVPLYEHPKYNLDFRVWGYPSMINKTTARS